MKIVFQRYTRTAANDRIPWYRLKDNEGKSIASGPLEFVKKIKRTKGIKKKQER